MTHVCFGDIGDAGGAFGGGDAAYGVLQDDADGSKQNTSGSKSKSMWLLGTWLEICGTQLPAQFSPWLMNSDTGMKQEQGSLQVMGTSNQGPLGCQSVSPWSRSL